MLELSEQYHAQRRSRHHYVLYLVAGVISLVLSAWSNARVTVINPDAICYLLSAQAITEQGFKAGMQFCPQAMWPFYSLLLSTIVQITHLSYQFVAYAVDSLFTLMTVLMFIAIIDVLGASKRVLWLAAAVILLSHEFNYVRQYIVRDHGFWAFYMVSMYCMLRYFIGSRLSPGRQNMYSSGRHATDAWCNADARHTTDARHATDAWCNADARYTTDARHTTDARYTTDVVPAKAGIQKYAIFWSISLVLATLFRIEGAIFMLALPLAVFFQQQPWRERFKAFFTFNLLTIVAGAMLVCWVVLHPEHAMEKLGRLPEVAHQLQGGVQAIADRYQAMRVAVIEHVLTLEAARDASLVLVLMLLTWYLLNVIGNLSWIYTALVAYAWIGRVTKFIRPAWLVLMAYVIVNLVVTLSFFAEHLFLAKRYLIAFSLTLMIWVPYAIDSLIAKRALLPYRRMLYATAALVFISAISGIFDFGYSKGYIRQAGSWLASNVPSGAKLYVNDPQLMYYSEHNRDVFFKVIKGYVDLNEGIAGGKWKKYDYIALRLSHHPDEKTMTVMRAMPLSSITEFANKRGDKVIVYKVKK